MREEIVLKRNRRNGQLIDSLKRRIGTYLYPEQELDKLIAAYKKQYNISDCDPLPYYPKGINIALKGEIIIEK